MYRKYRIVESIASSVSQYESYRDQVYRYTPNYYTQRYLQIGSYTLHSNNYADASCRVVFKTHIPLEKMAAISRKIFSMHFLEWKVLYFN